MRRGRWGNSILRVAVAIVAENVDGIGRVDTEVAERVDHVVGAMVWFEDVREQAVAIHVVVVETEGGESRYF